MAEVLDFFDARRDRVIRQIASFAQPRRGHGGLEAPPSADVLELAGCMVYSLGGGYSLPSAGPTEEGGVGFAWAVRGARVEATLFPDLTLAWGRVRGGEFDAGDMGASERGGFPAALLRLIAL
jgi:hypothetical protein